MPTPATIAGIWFGGTITATGLWIVAAKYARRACPCGCETRRTAR